MIYSVSGNHKRVVSPKEKACEILALHLANALQVLKENIHKEPGITPTQASSVLNHACDRVEKIMRNNLKCDLDVATGYTALLR
jgi:hypothetical protein